LADLFLAYDDPGDYGGTETELPLHVAWLYGFGIGPAEVTPVTPVHAAEIWIVDADGNRLFDSTQATSFSARAWGTRLYIYEWQTDEAVCRVVVHTAWPDSGEPVERTYSSSFVPDAAILDARSSWRLPQRVRSVTVGATTFTDIRRMHFAAGYNLNLTYGGRTAVRGQRAVEQLNFAAVPGAGLGRYPDCTPAPLTLRSINGVGPTTSGDFLLAAADCYWLRRPLQHLDVQTVVAYIPLEDPTTPLEETLRAPAFPLAITDAQLQLGSDCQACCQCEDYVAAATRLNRERDRYCTLGQMSQTVRNRYYANRRRWLESRRCYLRRPLRLLMQPQRCPLLDVVLQYCNQSEACKLDVDLTVEFTALTPLQLVPGSTFIVGAETNPGRFTGMRQPYLLTGTWPTYTVHWDQVHPYQSVFVQFRLVGADCTTPQVLTGCLTGTIGAEDITVPTVDDTGTEPASDCQAATLRCPAQATDYDNSPICPVV
jgi:hypothetical protein